MRELMFALAILAIANTASAEDASWLVSPGDHAILMTDRIACPEESDLKKLQTDVFNHDKEGYIEDAIKGRCTVINAKERVLVIGSDGWLDPWFQVRVPTQGAYWIDDVSGMKGDEPEHVLRKLLAAPSPAQTQSPYTAALAAGQAVVNQRADWYYKDDDEEGAECHTLPAKTPQQFLDAAAGRGATNLEITGNDILKADAVVSYDLRDKNYEYSLYGSHEKCANPFGATDNTKPDFSTISPPILDKMQQALADEALKRATDKGPWWMLDGTKTTTVCKPSKLTPMQDARSAKAKGARNIQIEGGLVAANVPHPTDVVVEYDFNDKSFFNDYYKNKDCDDSGAPSQAEKDTPSRKTTSSEVGNGSCWGPTDHGDNGRPDISCRALTESFLMSMRGKTEAQVQEAMGVKGRPIDNGMHFISNYSRGANENNDGDMNFLFDAGGHVSVIYGSFDDDHNSAYIWNARLLPKGCSDLPHTKMAPCDGNSDDSQHQIWVLRVSGASQQDIDAAIAIAHKLSGQ